MSPAQMWGPETCAPGREPVLPHVLNSWCQRVMGSEGLYSKQLRKDTEYNTLTVFFILLCVTTYGCIHIWVEKGYDVLPTGSKRR